MAEIGLTLKGILLGVIIISLLGTGMLKSGTMNLYAGSTILQFNPAVLLNKGIIAPILLIFIIATGYDWLLNSRRQIYYPENIISAVFMAIFVEVANPATTIMQISGIFSVIEMLFIFYVSAMIGRNVFRMNSLQDNHAITLG